MFLTKSIPVRTADELAAMRRAGRVVAEMHERIREAIRPGVSTADLDRIGREVLAPVEGLVVAADDGQEDHAAHRGLASVAYALTQGRRAAAGWPALAGNHVLVQTRPGAVVALCHLQQGSVHVRVGDVVRVGQKVGRCGNSGNSTEPHLHVQALDCVDVEQARPVRVTFRGSLPRAGEVVGA